MFVALAGLVVWAWTDSDASTCRGGLVGSLDASQCSAVTFRHDIATSALWTGVAASVVIIAALLLRRRRS